MRDDDFEWDDRKSASNLRKHKVSFSEARSIFDDPRALEEPLHDDSTDEERVKRIGLGAVGLLAVIYTERVGGDRLSRTRIISAWKATKNEQAQYNEDNESQS